jgi:PAS domain S-box-containing protein
MITGLFSSSNFSFNIHAVPPLVTAFFVLLLGLLVVVREKGTRVSLLYLSYTLAVCAWLFPVSLALFMKSEESAYAWMKFANAGVTMIPAALYHFTVVVLGLEKGKRRHVRLGWVISSLFLAVSLSTNVLFDGFYHYSWGVYLKFRWPAILFIFYFLVMTVETLRLYWLEYRKTDPTTTRHRRARELLVAFSIGYIGALDFLPALGVPYYPLSSVPMICMLILVSRAIWRYRLADITPAFAAREIIENMNDALIVVDAERVVRLVNQATCSLLGCREEDLIGKRPVDGMAACLTFAERFESIIGKGAVRNVEVEYGPHNGVFRTFNMSASLMRNRSGEPAATVCLLNDITERKRAEKEREELIARLQEANEKLQSIDKMKTNFISLVSHELRTPLTTIKAFVELLLMKPDMPEKQKERLMCTINVEADRLSRLITDVLDQARIESGSMKWSMEEVCLEEIVMNVMASMQVLFENKNLRVTTAFNSPLPCFTGDRDRLIQVVTNILSNAAKFTRPGDAIHVAVRQEVSPAQLVAEISDTGIGIPEKDLGLIFEKFYRSEDKRIAGIEGSGLGLAIARQIIEHHGGRIWAASTFGKGSTFTFTLPLPGG